MPVPRHIRVRIIGAFGNTDQTWSIGLAFGPPGTTGLEANSVTQAEAGAAAAAIRALNGGNIWSNDLRGIISSYVSITSIRVSVVGPAGREELVGLTQIGSPVFGLNAVRVPTEVCIAVSLRTDLPGRRRRGRVYLPALAHPVGGDGLLGGGGAAGIAAPFGAWLDTIRQTLVDTTGAVQLLPVVASTAGNVLTEVTTVAVGSVFDVQRRRGNQQREIYAVAPVAQ